ncbi:hypothetical protein NC652_035570 [Populus alba x Populus x berolinensis]|nr:hypothetical protein NC652_035570 [Populus alba x Populus x berolinensis]
MHWKNNQICSSTNFQEQHFIFNPRIQIAPVASCIKYHEFSTMF